MRTQPPSPAEKKLLRRAEWLDELLAMSRGQRRARGIRASKLDIIREREIVRQALRAQDTSIPMNWDASDTSGGAHPNE